MRTLVTIGGERDYPGHVPSGPVGRRLVARLVAAGQSVRVLAPQAQADGWAPEIDVVIGDVTDPGPASAVFEGIDRMFLASAVPETVHEVVTLARRGGARRIVLLSSHGPEVEIGFTPDSWYWLAIEVVVERSGASWTHLQPSPIMAQTLEPGFPDTGSDVAAAIRAGKVVREANPDAPYPLTDEDDLAAVAMVALHEARYTGQTLTVHGEPISLREQLDLIGRTLGRTIAVEELTPEQTADRYRRHGVTDDEIGEWLATEDEPAPHDPGLDRWMTEGVDTITRILGRPPRTYADWLDDHIDLLQ